MDKILISKCQKSKISEQIGNKRFPIKQNKTKHSKILKHKNQIGENMTKIRYVDFQGNCINCKSKILGNHDACWREATREELDEGWKMVSKNDK